MQMHLPIQDNPLSYVFMHTLANENTMKLMQRDLLLHWNKTTLFPKKNLKKTLSSIVMSYSSPFYIGAYEP
jgi:hypothetical protein